MSANVKKSSSVQCSFQECDISLLSEFKCYLFQVGGVECLSDILSEEKQAECVRCEAAGVIAQITSPCLDYYQHMTGFIEHMDDLVKSLTGEIFMLLSFTAVIQ